MAFNAFMHPRNIYKDNPPNFKELASKYKDFKEFCTVDLKGKVSIDFKNPEAVRALTRALLTNDFDLDVELPPDCLVPRIPLRLNYLLWLEDVVAQIPRAENTEPVLGVDIGTGASCIYPLLGAKTAGWHFVATERDSSSTEVARQNVDRNGLRDLIEVVKVDEHTALCGVVDALPDRSFHFCMCNPPFYDIGGELRYCASAGRPGRPEPHSASIAKLNEVCAEGGEVGFVSKIIADSVKLATRVRLYTSMIGKKASLGPLKAKLRGVNVADMCVTTFSQGKTQRWALAWTFLSDFKLKTNNQTGVKKKRPPLLYEIPPDALRPYTFEKLEQVVVKMLDELEITHVEVESVQRSALSRSKRFSAEAKRNTWAHNRRKRRAVDCTAKDVTEKALKLEGEDAVVPRNGGSSKNQDGNAVVSFNSNGNSSKLITDQVAPIESSSSSLSSDRGIVGIRNETGTEASEQLLSKFDLTLKLWDTKLVLELQFVDGENPDALHQILQFLKNRIR